MRGWHAKYPALALIWGASFLFMKLGLGALAAMQTATWRIVCGFLTLAVLLVASGPDRGFDRDVSDPPGREPALDSPAETVAHRQIVSSR